MVSIIRLKEALRKWYDVPISLCDELLRFPDLSVTFDLPSDTIYSTGELFPILKHMVDFKWNPTSIPLIIEHSQWAKVSYKDYSDYYIHGQWLARATFSLESHHALYRRNLLQERQPVSHQMPQPRTPR